MHLDLGWLWSIKDNDGQVGSVHPKKLRQPNASPLLKVSCPDQGHMVTQQLPVLMRPPPFKKTAALYSPVRTSHLKNSHGK